MRKEISENEFAQEIKRIMEDKTIKELLQAKKTSLSCDIEDVKDMVFSEINRRMDNPYFSFDDLLVKFKWNSQIHATLYFEEMVLTVYIPTKNCNFSESDLDAFMLEQGFLWSPSKRGWKMDID